jgi:uncharacterized membrane protein YdbT with pleckstrin-like domain
MDLPQTIKKSWVGYVWIIFVGVAVVSIIWSGIFYLGRTGLLDDGTFWMLAIVSLLAALITFVYLYVYDLSYIELDADGIKAENWSSLLSQVDVNAEWFRVQDVGVEQHGLGVILNYGTLTIQTAGTQQRVLMTMVPQPEMWQGIISEIADLATPDGLEELSTAEA